MYMCVPFGIDSLLVFILCYQEHNDTSQFESIMEKCTSLDVDNLTYLDGCCLFGSVNLRKTHNLLYCGFYKNKIVFLWFSCFIALNRGLYCVVVSASHSCTTNGNPLSSFLRKD